VLYPADEVDCRREPAGENIPHNLETIGAASGSRERVRQGLDDNLEEHRAESLKSEV
jgi:hypothetical protein